jgi:type IV pilus assembly protein PilY1
VIGMSSKLAFLRRALRSVSAGFALALFCGTPALADDTEIFLGNMQSARPNILLIFDTSGSMSSDVTGAREPFDPQVTYAGTCQPNAIYWRVGSGTQPDCNNPNAGGDNFFAANQLTCDAAAQAIAAVGFSGLTFSAQWDPEQQIWIGLDPAVKDQPVECKLDSGVHGPDATDVRRFPADEDQWTNVEADKFDYTRAGTNSDHRFYSSNWLNWLQSPPASTPPSRMQVAQLAARALVQTVGGVNFGLMRYSNTGGDADAAAEGGMVVFPISPIETSRAALVDQINQFQPGGFTPLSETLFEARQYFAGDDVVYGVDSVPVPSVPESRTGTDGERYLSPADAECQRNFVIYLTDGLPTRDTGAQPAIESLIGGTCDDDTGQDADGSGRCLDDLADYMFNNDQRPAGGPSPAAGNQNVAIYTVGFGEDVAGSPYLVEVANRGGGEAFEASDSVSLTSAFDNIIADIADVGTTFVAPAVTVNAFNRTETMSDVYLSMFQPADTIHWAGNVKKYRFNEQGELVGADGTTVIDQNGFFEDDARSIWSGQADGGEATLGGAAHELPNPAQRNLYTFLGTNPDLTDASNAVNVGNIGLTDVLLGLIQAGQPARNDLIDWARGRDVNDEDADNDTTEARNAMGDPLHSRPAVVIYGGPETDPDAVVYATTNDGYLHAIDTRDGEELWSFIPADLLNRLPALFANDESTVKHYGLDGDVRALRIDLDRDGEIEPSDGDKVYLYFGMGRGGSNYYALDVTSKNSPQHLWTLTPNELPGVGQTWSPAQFTRVNIRGETQNALQIALVFGGGYDPTQDNDQVATLYNTDTVGNRIFMVDAENGDLLWYGGGPGVGDADLDLSLPRMNNSIPSGIRVIDFDSDGFGDRMYAADTGGRVWRLDIITDTDATAAGVQVPNASELVTGGRFATLGAADPEAGSDNAATRRFYNTPDVALIRRRGTDVYLNVALGSGWRGHPLNTDIQDFFFSLRDYSPFTKFTQADYNSRAPIVVDDLVDITTNVTPSIPDGTLGWRLELRLPSGFEGEKVLAESRTFDNQVFFPTYLPETQSGDCAPIGSNRAYAVNVDNGSPVQDINRDGETTPTDRYTDLAIGGIAPSVQFFFHRRPPGDGQGDSDGDGIPDNQDPDAFDPVSCASGWVNLRGLCDNGGTVTRTYWRSSR